MKRTIDPCQTGWDSVDQPDIGLLTLYHSICHNSDSRTSAYRPHHFPLRTLPAQCEFNCSSFLKDDRNAYRNQTSKQSKFTLNRKTFKDRMKRYLINRQQGRSFCTSNLEEKGKDDKQIKQKSVKIKQFNFREREEPLYHVSVDSSRKNGLNISGIEGRNARKRICVKDQLEKIVKNRRKQAKQKSDLILLERNRDQQERMIKGEKAPLIQIHRYSTLDHHYPTIEGSQDSLSSEKIKKNMYLDCSIVNLSDKSQNILEDLPKKRYSQSNHHSFRQKKTKSQLKRYEPPQFRDKKQLKQIYHSNLLRQFEDATPRSNYCEFKAIMPEKNVMRLKEIIRSYLNNKRQIKSERKYPKTEHSP